MLKGGYQIVDFKDINITTTGVVIVGIYETIEASHRKALLASGITIDGVAYRDTWIDPTHADNNYTVTIAGHTVTITNDDTVTEAAA